MAQQVKRLSIYISTLILSIFVTNCSVDYHINKAMKKGYKCENVSDTIHITSIDSFPVIMHDSIVWEKFLSSKDTIIMWKTHYIPKTKWEKKIEYKLKRDTIRQIEKVEVAKYKSQKKTHPNIWLFIIGFLLGLITKYLLKYANKAL